MYWRNIVLAWAAILLLLFLAAEHLLETAEAKCEAKCEAQDRGYSYTPPRGSRRAMPDRCRCVPWQRSSFE